jgi:hypothetical protein
MGSEGSDFAGPFAPANWQDADDERPISFESNDSTPFTTAINNVVSRHVHEIKEKVPPTQIQWKRRLREFLLTKVDDLLEFAARPLVKHPTLGPAEALLRRFSRGNFQPTHHTLRGIAMDGSGVDLTPVVEEGLKKFDSGLKGFQAQSQWLMNEYKDAGEEIIRLDTTLQMRLDVFDRAQKKIVVLTELKDNEAYQPLAEATEAYLEKVFSQNEIESIYVSLIQAYRKFLFLRDTVSIRGTVDDIMGEPLCSICCTEKILFGLNPCGHTYCATCVKKQISQCYICRGAVRDRVKLFFG